MSFELFNFIYASSLDSMITYVSWIIFYNVPHRMGLPDHVPLLRHTLSVVVVVVGAYSLLSSQTKQAVEPAIVPL